MWTWWEACLILCPAAILGGAINSIAGGGTLVTFPTLLLVLGDATGAAIMANATNTVALFPGSVSGTWAYRRELEQIKDWAKWLAIPSFIGGAVGSLIVADASETSFKAMVPWLIALATVLFILQPRLVRAAPASQSLTEQSTRYRWLVFFFQLLIGIYGGYFGAGIGILMLSSLSLLQIGNIHHVNGLKTILASLINGVSVVIFMYKGVVHWGYAGPMIVSAIIGGWLGASWARTLDKTLVRRIVIGIGLVLTTWYFIREFFLAS